MVSSFVVITIRERGMGGGDCIECNSCRKHAEEKQQWKILVVSRHFVSHLFISSFCPKFWPMTLRDVLDWIGLATYQLINLRPMFVFWNPSGFGQVPFHLGFPFWGLKNCGHSLEPFFWAHMTHSELQGFHFRHFPHCFFNNNFVYIYHNGKFSSHFFW